MKENDTNQGSPVLNETLEKAHRLLKQGVTPRFVFDLDSTLFCVSPRTEFILRKFAQEAHIQDQFPEAAAKLQSIKATPSDWGIKTVLNRHGIKETLQFFEAAREYWIQHFFSSHHLDQDTPYPGAVKFVNHVHNQGVEVYYLTGRDRQRMEAGTLKSLAYHGFPLKSPDCLRMKPDTSVEDTLYKLQVFSEWSDLDLSKVWFFENEPVIINKVAEKFPEIQIVYMHSVNSGREQAPEHLPRIRFEWNFTNWSP